MSGIVKVYPPTPAGSSLSADTNPNTTEPPEDRIFYGPERPDVAAQQAYVTSIGGSLTVQLWMWSRELKRWFSLCAATACAQDAATLLPNVVPDGGAKLFAAVTAGAGTQFGVGFTGRR
jgi:hypothetical protein